MLAKILLNAGLDRQFFEATVNAHRKLSPVYPFFAQNIHIKPTTPAIAAANATRIPRITNTKRPILTAIPISIGSIKLS